MREATARSILSPVTGFLREAGFTHSLTPARNCTFGCSYCYVPTLRVYGGLKREDWERWGQFTTLKTNAAELAARETKPDQVVYCSPLVDPYQPTEAERPVMPDLLRSLAHRPPKIFVLQTRGPLVLRDVELLKALPCVRVSFSITTNREEVRRRYEPHCASFEQRLQVVRALKAAGIPVWCTLAPLLPCDPEELAESAIDASGQDLIGDPLHVRATKAAGATTRDAAYKIAAKHGELAWFEPAYQQQVVTRIEGVARRLGRSFGCGPSGFSLLSYDAGSAPG